MSVENEISQLAENVKSTHESLNKTFDEFKSSTEEAQKEFLKKGDIDPLLEAKNQKMTDDLVKLQEAVDLATTKMNRPQFGIDSYNDADKKQQEAQMFFKSTIKARPEGDDVVIGNERVIEKGVANLKIFNEYKSALAYHMKNPNFKTIPSNIEKELSVGSDPDGGYTVTPEMSNQIISRQFESSPLRQVANVETISSMSYQIIDDPEEYTASRTAEGSSTANTGTGSFGKREIVAHTIEARPKSTPEMVEDSMFNIEAHIANKIGKKFARVEGNEFINGTGVGQARGITDYAAGTTWGTTIEQITSGANGSVTYAQLAAIATSLKEGYYSNAQWLLHRTLIGKILGLTGASTPLWIPSIAVGQPSTLMGYPVRFAQDFATPATNSLSGAFGDFRAAYTWVDRKGISIMPDPYSEKPYIEYYARSRSGGDVVDTDAVKIIKLAA